MTDQPTTPIKHLNLVELSSLIVAVTVYLARDDNTIIDQIGAMASAIEAQYRKDMPDGVETSDE